MEVKLTAYSHGAGCGCKLSPSVLSEMLHGISSGAFEQLLVGNDKKDDAAVYQIDKKNAIISTTDFFMPIVDDPAEFGGIAATNAISDIYAMGGTPMMAIAILGWPIDKLNSSIAREVLKGGRQTCERAGIPLAGGHSIDAPEPIFGLAVTGKVLIKQLKTNDMAKPEDLIYLTKPVGVGLVATAQKKGIAGKEDLDLAIGSMLTLNDLGSKISRYPEVHAITDVTGFGLAGHLIEVCEASGVGAEIELSGVPRFSFVDKYLDLGTTPGGTQRNWSSYGNKVLFDAEGTDHRLLADPQTSGGLLITIDPGFQQKFEQVTNDHGMKLKPLGRMVSQHPGMIQIN